MMNYLSFVPNAGFNAMLQSPMMIASPLHKEMTSIHTAALLTALSQALNKSINTYQQNCISSYQNLQPPQPNIRSNATEPDNSKKITEIIID